MLEGLVLFRLEVKAGGLGTVVWLLTVLMPAGSLMAGSLMAVPRLAGRTTGGPKRALVEVLVPVVAQGRLELTRECRQWGQVKLRGTKRVRGDEVY